MSDTTREIPKLTHRRLGSFNRFSSLGRKAERRRANELYALRKKFKGNIGLLNDDPNGAAKPLKVGTTPPRAYRQIHVQHESSRKRGTLRDFPSCADIASDLEFCFTIRHKPQVVSFSCC
jgi:hypothetical protein